jgi:hypothetical protein
LPLLPFLLAASCTSLSIHRHTRSAHVPVGVCCILFVQGDCKDEFPQEPVAAITARIQVRKGTAAPSSRPCFLASSSRVSNSHQRASYLKDHPRVRSGIGLWVLLCMLSVVAYIQFLFALSMLFRAWCAWYSFLLSSLKLYNRTGDWTR